MEYMSEFALTAKEEFIGIFTEKITRQGSEKLLDWLKKSDFFTAPASTRYHLSCEGGLCRHSINVYNRLKQIYEEIGEKANEESLAICALLHDICKANFYSVSMRNKKNEMGQWESVPYYTISDSFPYGHGEKSVFQIMHFMHLNADEAMAIRWHMGPFDDAVKGGSFALSEAYGKYPLALHLHTADMRAAYLDEK